MMGLYFAATGFGNKVAGVVGEISQGEPTKIEITAGKAEITPFVPSADSLLAEGEKFSIKTELYPADGKFMAVDANTGQSVLDLIAFEKPEKKKEITRLLEENNVTKADPYHATFKFEKDPDAKKALVGNHLNYSGVFTIDEIQTDMEFRTFVGITIFTALFGLLVILMLKPLKRLTHGVEDDEQ